MKRLLGSVLVVLFLGSVGASEAHAEVFVDGTLDFTLSHGGPAPTGSFVFDYTADQFTSFSVDWDNNVYDFTSIANTDDYYASLPISGEQWCGIGKALNGFCGGNDSFFLSFGSAFEMGASVPFLTDMAGSDEANGTYSVTCLGPNGGPIPCPAEPTASTPEPKPFGLLMLSIGLLGLVSRWQAHHKQLA